MILIVDNTQRKMKAEIRTKMMRAGIPCVVVDSAHADEYMPAAVIVVTEKYLLRDIEYISNLNGKAPVFLWDEQEDLMDFSMGKFRELHGDIFENSKISRVRTQPGRILFCGKPMHLTKTEKRILYLFQYAPRWYDKSTIAAYCLKCGKKGAESVIVHICNINTKANKLAGCDIIECKRYQGYRLRMF